MKWNQHRTHTMQNKKYWNHTRTSSHIQSISVLLPRCIKRHRKRRPSSTSIWIFIIANDGNVSWCIWIHQMHEIGPTVVYGVNVKCTMWTQTASHFTSNQNNLRQHTPEYQASIQANSLELHSMLMTQQHCVSWTTFEN